MVSIHVAFAQRYNYTYNNFKKIDDNLSFCFECMSHIISEELEHHKVLGCPMLGVNRIAYQLDYTKNLMYIIRTSKDNGKSWTNLEKPIIHTYSICR